MFEEFRHDFGSNVLWLDPIGGYALLDNFQRNFLHLFVRGSEFTNQNHHDLAGVIVGVHRVHERNDETDGLEERG